MCDHAKRALQISEKADCQIRHDLKPEGVYHVQNITSRGADDPQTRQRVDGTLSQNACAREPAPDWGIGKGHGGSMAPASRSRPPVARSPCPASCVPSTPYAHKSCVSAFSRVSRFSGVVTRRCPRNGHSCETRFSTLMQDRARPEQWQENDRFPYPPSAGRAMRWIGRPLGRIPGKDINGRNTYQNLTGPGGSLGGASSASGSVWRPV
jgi:hypothetical protein